MSSLLAEIDHPEINFDIRDVHIDANGVKDFYYPTLPQLDCEPEEQFLRMFAEHVQKLDPQTITYDALKLCAKYYCSEVCGIFQAEKAIANIKLKGITPKIRSDWVYWHSAYYDKPLPKSKFIQFFRSGPQKKSIWKQIISIRRFVTLFQKSKSSNSSHPLQGNYRFTPISKETLNNGIVASERLPLMIEHSKKQKGPVYFSRLYHLLHPVHEHETAHKLFPNIGGPIIMDTEKIFLSLGQPLSTKNSAHLRTMLEELLGIFSVHLERLHAHPEKLPKNLWIASCGDKWGGILAAAVRKNGGRVTAHDHAGNGHVNMLIMGFVESMFCDQFITFTPGHAQSYIADQESWGYFGTRPVITGLQDKGLHKYKALNKYTRTRKKIMYITTIFEMDRARIGASPPDLLRVDFQARHIRFLIEQGYEVFLKPHPESPLPLPTYFHHVKGLTILNEPFMTVYDQADHIIFDYLHTSTFKEALHTNIPITLIDLENTQWSEMGKNLIAKRISILQARFDEQNRAKDLYKELLAAMDLADAKANDTSFIEFFYGNQV